MKYYKRGFLNETEGMAAFEASLDVYGDNNLISADFSITDCSRKITLDFWANEPKDVAKITNKIDTLILELINFKDAIVEHGKNVKKEEPCATPSESPNS